MKIDIFWNQKFREESYVTPTALLTEVKPLTVRENQNTTGPRFPLESLEGEPVFTEKARHLQYFVGEARKKYPYFSFGVEGTYIGNYVYVYMPEQCYTLGAIGYGDFVDESTKDDPDMYTVWSPHIRNGRYNFGKQLHMKSSQRIGRAVDNMKYLRPHTASSYFLRAGSTMDDAYVMEVDERREEVNKAKFKITGYPKVFFDEMLAAHRHSKLLDVQPYKFSDVLTDRLDMYLSTVAETDALLQNVSTSMYQVHVTENGFEVALIDLGKDRFKDRGSRNDANVTMEPVQHYSKGELPEGIARKLSVLDVAYPDIKGGDRKFILGIGWVAVHRQLYYVIA